MKHEMYMDGCGIIERTRELNEALFAAVLPAIVGTTAIFAGPFTSWIFLIHNFSWEPKATQGHWIVAGLISATSIISGVWISLPWYRAHRAVKEHTKNMDRETVERGRGWARS